LLVVFTETSAPEALEAWARLHNRIDPALADRLRVGFASFPEDNPTWQGLKALAFEREGQEAFAGDVSGVTTLRRAAVASEA
jgi:hypothetical protein